MKQSTRRSPVGSLERTEPPELPWEGPECPGPRNTRWGGGSGAAGRPGRDGCCWAGGWRPRHTGLRALACLEREVAARPGPPCGVEPQVTRAHVPHRAECATNMPPGLASLASAEVTSAPGVAVLPEAAVAATTVPSSTGPSPATLTISPVPAAVAVTTAAPVSPAISSAAALGLVTKNR